VEVRKGKVSRGIQRTSCIYDFGNTRMDDDNG
jgi:hypothetical protein